MTGGGRPAERTPGPCQPAWGPGRPRTHHERALAIDEAVLEPDHPIVAADRGNLNRIVQQLEGHQRTRAIEKLKTDACRHVSFGYVEQSSSAASGRRPAPVETTGRALCVL